MSVAARKRGIKNNLYLYIIEVFIRTIKQKILIITSAIIVLFFYILISDKNYQTLSPPKKIQNLKDLSYAYTSGEIELKFYRQIDEQVIFTSKPINFISSSPTAYIFDREGTMKKFVRDIGDSNNPNFDGFPYGWRKVTPYTFQHLIGGFNHTFPDK